MERVKSPDIELITEVYAAYLVNRNLPPESHVPLPMVDYTEPGPSVDDLLEVHWQDGEALFDQTWNRREREPGESPGPAIGWRSIHWKKAHRAVRRLQARIVKAVRLGKWHKVKALVYLLTHCSLVSSSTRLLVRTFLQERRGDAHSGANPLWSSYRFGLTVELLFGRHGSGKLGSSRLASACSLLIKSLFPS